MEPRGSLRLSLLAAAMFACTPDVGEDRTPEAMEFDSEATPPRVPQPTGLIVDPATGHIDFALAGTPLPPDCAESTELSPAECAFDRYLESLDGYPSVTPATAPVTAELDPTTLSLGNNVVVLSSRQPSRLPELEIGFDATAMRLVIAPKPSWALGEYYWLAVRGYGGGVRSSTGAEVVGSPTIALLKQTESLTCAAATPEELDAGCPALRLLAQTQPEQQAKEALFTLEAIRTSYEAAGVWQRFSAAGLPKDEIAVLWGFPIHSSTVVEVDPNSGLVPRISGARELRVGVHGVLDGATVVPFIANEQPGSVTLMDLNAAATGDLPAALPRIAARYEGGEIVIEGEDDFVSGHQYGLFMSDALRDARGDALVPAPISALLTSRFPLFGGDGKSAISALSNKDAATLEAGRRALGPLLDDPTLASLSGIVREKLVYCYIFAFEAAP